MLIILLTWLVQDFPHYWLLLYSRLELNISPFGLGFSTNFGCFYRYVVVCRPGGTPENYWWGCRPVLQILARFQTNNIILHTRFQIRPLKSIPVFRPGLSYSFGIETRNTFIYSVDPSKTIPDSRTKWAKCIPVFRPKRPKNPSPMRRHILIWLIWGSTRPGYVEHQQSSCFPHIYIFGLFPIFFSSLDSGHVGEKMAAGQGEGI